MRLGGVKMLDAIQRLSQLFAEVSPDRSTLDELVSVAGDRGRWHGAHDLFQRIRKKSLDVARRNDTKLLAQYGFEEACAKTLYNLSGKPAPFDADSPYWIVPDALVAAREYGIEEGQIVKSIVV